MSGYLLLMKNGSRVKIKISRKVVSTDFSFVT